MDKTMTALIIMDGFGINPAHDGNAIFHAEIINFRSAGRIEFAVFECL